VVAVAFAIGSRGTDVLKLQKDINAANKGKTGYVPLVLDGIFGPKTDAAYKAYSAPKVTPTTNLTGLPTTVPKQPVVASASPVLDSNGNAYIMTGNGFATVGKGANGSYLLGNGERFATADEAGKIKPLVSNAMSGIPITGSDLSSLAGLKTGTPTSPVNSTDPTTDKINALLDKYLNYDPNTPIDVTGLPQYGALKQQYDNAGQSAFNNQIGRLSSLTGGRPSTAAVGTATDAQNEYAQEFNSTVIPGLISNEQAKRQNTMSNIFDKLQALQGFKKDAQAETDRARQEWLGTIGQFGQDYTAEMNRVRDDGDTSNDWQLGYLQAARQDKLAGMGTAQAKADKDAYDNAMEAWKVSGKASAEVAKILGVPVGAKTADYEISSTNANTSRINANKSGGSGTGSDKSTLTNSQIYSQAKSLLDEKVPSGGADADGKPIMRPKYTKQQFEKWLDSVLPKTEEGDKMYDDIVNALDIDNAEFYTPPQSTLGNVADFRRLDEAGR
jgi:hypothetical protein